jgi:predicted FMN-binding regulatory protein PaiB
MKRYPPELFSSEELQDAVEVAELVKFASIHPVDGTLCDPVFAPFMCTNRNEPAIFCAHLVRSNPLLEILSGGPLACRLVFQAVHLAACVPRTSSAAPASCATMLKA